MGIELGEFGDFTHRGELGELGEFTHRP